MVAFPDLLTSVPAQEPYKTSLAFKTLVAAFDNQGETTSKQKWLYPKRTVTLQYKEDGLAYARTIWQFYQARKGRHEAFSFFCPISDIYVGEYVGTGDGASTIWNLPVKTGSSYTVYLDGAALTGGGTDYTFGAAAGADGEDKITFTVAPSDGARITMDFTGFLKIRCNFAEDIMSWELFLSRIFTAGLKLQGRLNA